MTPELDPMTYVEDFNVAWTLPGRTSLCAQVAAAVAAGLAAGGLGCCGTTGAWHRPWCMCGPRRRREPAVTAGEMPGQVPLPFTVSLDPPARSGCAPSGPPASIHPVHLTQARGSGHPGVRE